MQQIQVALAGEDAAPTPAFSVRVLGAEEGQGFQVQGGETLLGAMERQGRQCIDVGCRGGGCGVCKVRVIQGEVRCGPMSANRVTPQEREQGFSLACRTYPCSDLLIERIGGPANRVVR